MLFMASKTASGETLASPMSVRGLYRSLKGRPPVAGAMISTCVIMYTTHEAIICVSGISHWGTERPRGVDVNAAR